MFMILVLALTVSFGDGTQIISVIDGQLTEFNPYLEKLLTPNAAINTDMDVIISNETHTIVTFNEVCQKLKSGALMLIDMSSPAVGPLLRSFARAYGLVITTVMDRSLLLPVDELDELRINIQPPGIDMLNVVPDIVKFEKFDKVVILYDKSFDLQQTPRNVLSGVSAHHIYHELTRNATQMRSILGEVADLEINNIFIIGASSSVDYILGEANGHTELKTEEINWFVITKDAKVTCDFCYKRTRIALIQGDYTFGKMNTYVDFMRRAFDNWFQSLNLKSDSKLPQHSFDISFGILGSLTAWVQVDEAFAYDMVNLLKEHMEPDLPLITAQQCYNAGSITNETLQNANLLLGEFANVNYSGVFGQIIRDNKGIRQKIKLNIKRVEFSKGSQVNAESLGIWTEERGLNVSTDSLIKEKSRKSYRVVVVPEYKPFIYKHVINNNSSSPQYRYTGFCIDLFNRIAEQLDFTYDIYETPDSLFGSLNDDGTWNGAINELIEKRADIAIGPISVMSERENVIDFTVPFHEPVGLTILMKKSKFEYSLHKFLSVLSIEVWGCIVASYFLFSILMWLFDRFSPYSYQNNPGSTKGPEKRVFTLKEGIWFCMTSLTPQGGGEAPKAVSGRLVAATWWLYGFLLIAFYTANLAAFLTVFRLETPIESLDDLTKQQSVQYGPMNGTSALVYFQRMQEIENQFYRIWKDMSLNDSLNPVERAKLAVWDYPVSEQFTKLMDSMFVPNYYKEALNMVKTGKFAFIDDATRNKYESLIDCDVEEIGEEFSRKPFALAVQQGSPLRSQMSQVMLELINNRVLEELTNTWWDSNELKKECPRIEDETDGISIKNIGGVFLVIVIGTIVSLIVLAAEVYYYKIRPSREAREYKVGRTARQHMNNGIQSGTSLETLTSNVPNGSSVTLGTLDSNMGNGDTRYFTYDSNNTGLTYRGYDNEEYQVSKL